MTAFALYNYACYNIEMLIKLLTFFIQRLQMFSVIFVTFLRFNDFYFNMNVFFTYMSYRLICTQSTLLASNEITTCIAVLRYETRNALSRAHTSAKPQQSPIITVKLRVNTSSVAGYNSALTLP